jgi:hypothetical protein
MILYGLDQGHLHPLHRASENVASHPGPPALQANNLCKEPFERGINCHSGSQLVLLQLPPTQVAMEDHG